MEINWKENMNEIGGAFVLSWMVFGMGLGTLEGAVALAVVWMAFSGAHVLPVVTWSHMMTGNMGDTEGNWMANGMRLVAQAVGAMLGILLATQFGDVGPDCRRQSGDLRLRSLWTSNCRGLVRTTLGETLLPD